MSYLSDDELDMIAPAPLVVVETIERVRTEIKKVEVPSDASLDTAPLIERLSMLESAIKDLKAEIERPRRIELDVHRDSQSLLTGLSGEAKTSA